MVARRCSAVRWFPIWSCISRSTSTSLIPRVLEGKGMDYWESGMHLALGSDIFDSFCNYQRRLIREFNALAREFHFITVDARKSPETIQRKLRDNIGSFLRDHKAAPMTLRTAQSAADAMLPSPVAALAPVADLSASVADEVEAVELSDTVAAPAAK